MARKVTAELLDELSPTDAAAVRSRRDLQRINAVMGNHRLLARALRATWQRAVRVRSRVVDLAAGDGTQILRVAKLLGPLTSGGELLLLDRQDLVTESTRAALVDLGWNVTTERTDVFAWIRRPVGGFDAIVTNLFLHHLQGETLGLLLEALAERTSLFAAIEPQRGTWPLVLSRLVAFLGCNHVTRHDAAASVRSGFVGHELSLRWPRDPAWRLDERSTGLASHVFVARRRTPA